MDVSCQLNNQQPTTNNCTAPPLGMAAGLQQVDGGAQLRFAVPAWPKRVQRKGAEPPSGRISFSAP
jgi:hypothetical protein